MARAKATGWPLEPGVLRLDDWLALALGVPSTRPLPALLPMPTL